MIQIRQYLPSDWNALQLIHDAARMQELHNAGLEAAFLPLCVAAEREALFDYQLFVAQVGDTVAGFVAFTDDELAWLYVCPEQQHRGIGKALARFALGKMKSKIKTVEVLSGNEPARKLYHSLGFTNEVVVHGKMPGNEDFAVSVWQMKTSQEVCV